MNTSKLPEKIMNHKIKLCIDLLELVENQDAIISKQKSMIASLVNENLEKENTINVLMQEQNEMY